ncbi:MAG: class IV adenylate cyclase [Candidatus Micrarchaeota archaeon]|nr:class IV adenylate cyclase [Candidatus Micrarchaeota archaeon]
MREIEVKFLEIDKEKIIEKLKSLGAKKSFEGNIEALYFDTGKKELKKKGIILRLRKKGDVSELTLKKWISVLNAKVMEEKESQVGDFQEIRNILHNLGYREIVRRRKYRMTYVLGDIHFEIDKIVDLPCYLEIEAPSIEKIRHAVDLLGLSMEDSKPWSEGDVRKHYRRKG